MFHVLVPCILRLGNAILFFPVSELKELSYRIPEDVQVIGFDNVTFSQFCSPALSSSLRNLGRLSSMSMQP